jgi:hypothetical protein
MLRQLQAAVIEPFEVICQPANLLLGLSFLRLITIAGLKFLAEAVLASSVEPVMLSLGSRHPEDHLHS